MSSEIEKQINEQMKKAFFDIINQNILSDKPDYEWLVSLYSELKERLLRILKKDSKTYKQIDSAFDIELFKQMIENDVFDYNSMVKLIDTTFFWIKQLQAPERDQYLKESKTKVLNSNPEEIIGNFLRAVHDLIDKLYEDLENYQTAKQT